MGMQRRSALLAAVVAALPLAARAQPVSGLYVGGGAGFNLPENPPLASGGHVLPGDGFAGLGSVGYGLGNGFRFELEGSYREAPLPAESNAVFQRGARCMRCHLFPGRVPGAGGGMRRTTANVMSFTITTRRRATTVQASCFYTAICTALGDRFGTRFWVQNSGGQLHDHGGPAGGRHRPRHYRLRGHPVSTIA